MTTHTRYITQSYIWIVLLGLVFVALLVSISQNSATLQKLHTLESKQFRDQLQEGKACGLVTVKEAQKILQNDVILESGSIIGTASPTVSSRAGSPRIDACTYVSPSSNGTYLDIVLKTYDSPSDARKYFAEATNTILFIQNVQVQNSIQVDELRYASGVYYARMHDLVIEVGASKIGASAGDDIQHFSYEVFMYVASKL